jgi:mannosyltransferase
MSAVTVRPQPVAGADDRPSRTRPARAWAEAAIAVVAIVFGAVLRVRTREDLWVDEALSISIAKLSVGDVLDALRHDGHPPVYYLLLHGWMRVFGEGATAVRALSTVLSLATLPLAWSTGKRYGGRQCALAALVLFAVVPSAVRFGSEARMYGLVVLLVLGAWAVGRRAWERPSLPRLSLFALLTGLLLLTQYWSFYLFFATAAVLLGIALRGSPAARSPARRLLAALGVGGLCFVPWLPVFLDQLRTTGTPWGPPARPAQVLASLLAGGGPSGEAQVLGVGLAVLALLALLAAGTSGTRIELELLTRPATRFEWALIALTLVLGVVGGYVGGVAFASRYTAVVLPLLILVAAFGLTVLPHWPWRTAAVALLVALGLLASLEESLEIRTQAPKVAQIIADQSAPGELVVYCPDQLGPGVSRLLPDDRRELTFPDLQPAERVDWVDYLRRIRARDPVDFADAVLDRAGDGPVWLVWAGAYRGLGRRCEAVVQALEARRPRPTIVTTPQEEGESAWVYKFPEATAGR